MTVVDRFEGQYAVLETDSGMKTVLRNELPADAREGDVLSGSGGIYSVDREKTAERRRSAAKRLNKLLRGKYD